MYNSAWYAKQYTDRYGMKTIPIKERSKLPVHKDFGNNYFKTATEAEDFYLDNPAKNIGFLLTPDGFCSLDIDCSESFDIILEEYGLPIDCLDKFPTIKGSDKGRRIVFKTPYIELDYQKLNWPTKEDQKIKFTVFEFRYAKDGKQRFDVLPPSIHPDTKKPYTWLVNPPATLEEWPEPPGWLLAMWTEWSTFKPQLVDLCPWIEKLTNVLPVAKKREYQAQENGTNPIDIFLDDNDLYTMLTQCGYSKKSGNRWLSPHSGTGLAGVLPFEDGQSCWIHHASDPLCSDDTGHPVNAFDLYCYYNHDGDMSKAVKQIVIDYDIKPTARKSKIVESLPILANDYIDFEHNTFEIFEDDAPTPEQPVKATQPASNHHLFLPLGFDDGVLYFLPRATEQITAINSASLRKTHALQLAPLEYWDTFYPKKTGADWDLVFSDLNRMCEMKGVYNPSNVRGRGAWSDDGKTILHLGDILIVDGSYTKISDHYSKFIYTRQSPMEYKQVSAATDAQSSEVVDIISKLSWTNDLQGLYLAGWIALAPICGALSWRPHLWVTSKRGSGKSWVQSKLISPLVGQSAMVVQGGTTEAGIRQSLMSDARPIIFDEAESEDISSQKRIQNVVELARQSSSDSGAEIVKGTVGGSAMRFKIRSMFLMGSINVAISHAADESRFTVVSLEEPNMSAEEFSKFEAHVLSLIDDDFCNSIRARSYSLIPVIRHNTKSFSRAVADKLGSQRIGDQIGTLLAGAISLMSSDKYTIQEAKAFIYDFDFSEAKESEDVSDETKCLDKILQSKLFFESDKGRVERSIMEIVNVASLNDTTQNFDHHDATGVLGRHGLRVDGGILYVSNSHNELARILKETPWHSNWRRVLLRIEGTKVSDYPIRFAGMKSRAVGLPINLID
jgi:putative DNA primase/helicase